MPGSCEVCSSEPSKYRCPTCALMSCSLACTQSHKIYCAPKPQATNEAHESSTPNNAEQPLANGVSQNEQITATESKNDKSTPGSIATSPEVTELFRRYPKLRNQLHDIYKSTLEGVVSMVEGGRAPTRRSRGPWTSEKGFNRGMGRVKKFRQDYEEGYETGVAAEAFVQFLNLVNHSQSE
ncbi:uncharacterized protein N7469_006368 [Penicillium citrinum]|uniref:HIT-type domain-containing protein n=1 Tax=Penicillium citrinum TaxID=5077 RepID=A0A9W9NYI7_PENCI|nr:uncharacterized protein N7469_006368 [Penicillium citrinum]KAJ5231780.1 hypothetical protein N7469_006368 [Penicillium citrinum]